MRLLDLCLKDAFNYLEVLNGISSSPIVFFCHHDGNTQRQQEVKDLELYQLFCVVFGILKVLKET